MVPDNCKTAVVHNGGWKDQQINETYEFKINIIAFLK